MRPTTAPSQLTAETRPKLRVWALLSVAVLIVSLLPLYAISIYNHPSYDDYGASATLRAAWVETGSLSAVVKAAFDHTIQMYNTWQGGFTPTFISSFQPAIFGEQYYAVTTWFLLTAFLLCTGFFLRTILRDLLHAGGDETAILTSLMLLLMVHFQPDAAEAMFWFNSGVGYLLMEALLLLVFALVTKLQLAQTAGKRIALTAVLCVLMFLQGGSNPISSLISVLVMAGVTVYGFVARKKSRLHNAVLFAVLVAGFYLMFSAPGNAARATLIEGSMTNPATAVVKACYYGAALAANWLTLPVLAALLLGAPLLARVSRNSGLTFSHPLLTVVVAAGLFCAQLAPTLYSGVFLGAGRTRDTYYDQYILLLFGLSFYLIGYVTHQFDTACLAGSDWAQGLENKLKTTLPRWGTRFALIGLCVLLCGVAGFRKYDDVSYGPQNTAGGSALLSLVKGEAKRYDAEMDAREAILNDASIPDPAFAPLTCVPDVFIPDLLRSDAAYDVTGALKAYYGKNSITLVDTPQEATQKTD